jgi:hypothetical protein
MGAGGSTGAAGAGVGGDDTAEASEGWATGFETVTTGEVGSDEDAATGFTSVPSEPAEAPPAEADEAVFPTWACKLTVATTTAIKLSKGEIGRIQLRLIHPLVKLQGEIETD